MDGVLVCILITTHPFDSIPGSEEGLCPMLALGPLFMMIQLQVIEIISVFIVLFGADNIL